MTPEILEPLSDTEKSVADHIHHQIEICLDSLSGAEDELTHSYARLGSLLLRTQKEKLWLLWDHKSFGGFLKSIEPRVKKGRSQIYAILGVAEQLLPVVSEENLTLMGIAKAGELRKVLRAGKPVSEAMIEKALDPKVTAQGLREMAFSEARIFEPEQTKGTYLDLGGIFLDAEERGEFFRAVERARIEDPPMPEIPNWSDASPVVKKEIIWRWCASFLA